MSVDAIKTVPYTPISHPFIERRIGTIRREYLNHLFFWNAVDLERKLTAFQVYYNHHRTHSSLGSDTRAEAAGCIGNMHIQLDKFLRQTHCQELYPLPLAA
jgi:putative transposase